jgi:hypothetical protein
VLNLNFSWFTASVAFEEFASMYDTVENRPTRAADSLGCLKKHRRKLTVLKGVNTFGEWNICVWLERDDPQKRRGFCPEQDSDDSGCDSYVYFAYDINMQLLRASEVITEKNLMISLPFCRSTRKDLLQRPSLHSLRKWKDRSLSSPAVEDLRGTMRYSRIVISHYNR